MTPFPSLRTKRAGDTNLLTHTGLPIAAPAGEIKPCMAVCHNQGTWRYAPPSTRKFCIHGKTPWRRCWVAGRGIPCLPATYTALPRPPPPLHLPRPNAGGLRGLAMPRLPAAARHHAGTTRAYSLPPSRLLRSRMLRYPPPPSPPIRAHAYLAPASASDIMTVRTGRISTFNLTFW